MANRKEYDPKDALMYAWEKEDMYGCCNDVISLVYDRVVCCGILPRKPSGLCVDEKFPVQYGVSHTRTSVYYDENTYSLRLFTVGKKQEELVKRVADALHLECIKHNNYIEINIASKWVGVKIDEFLKQNNLPLEYSNRLGFMQYPFRDVMRRRFNANSEKTYYTTWEKFDLCSILMTN